MTIYAVLYVRPQGRHGSRPASRSLSRTFPTWRVLVEPLLIVRRALCEQTVILHCRLLAIVRDDESGRYLG
jgi:hypothetical protein